MSGCFGADYAAAYDSIYAAKDYDAECRTVERALKAHSRRPVSSILDLGCGTGNHALPLARAGYRVVGVDLSEDMLVSARAKAGDMPVEFHQGDVREVALGRRFDAVLMMFAVLGYQAGNDDVKAALATVRDHLEPGGVFLFDVWYGPAVLAQRPEQRVRSFPTAKGEVLRVVSSALDSRHHRCTVSYDLLVMEGDRVAARSREDHVMRYFFPLELEMLLDSAGLDLVHLSDVDDLDRAPDESTWNVVGVAVAR